MALTAANADPKPVPPAAPAPSECCESGCDPCVYDRYWEALTNYERALQEWESRQTAVLPDPEKGK
ncbi:MAG: oxidoreductase-like domain-containing protein [Betaproteobacteria bacterium]|nr:oxidoreductase-like domain-containing protein [Betaproteobacteria bacterium]MDH4293623.1 oxidoreductase-like domain-containing protein [Betaproteobacteria bacterium]MDH5342545.1 oxidoreductase-like domain-containing protein [Betaproteobacteria bacterium]